MSAEVYMAREEHHQRLYGVFRFRKDLEDYYHEGLPENKIGKDLHISPKKSTPAISGFQTLKQRAKTIVLAVRRYPYAS
jgi:hypothetical protein